MEGERISHIDLVIIQKSREFKESTHANLPLLVSPQIVDPMHGQGDYDLVDHGMVARIVVHWYQEKERRCCTYI